MHATRITLRARPLSTGASTGSAWALLAATLLAGCQAGPSAGSEPPPSVHAEVEARNRSLEAAQRRGDATAVVAHYASDATLYTTGGESNVRGRDAIEASFGQLYRGTTVVAASLRTGAMQLRDPAEVDETGRYEFQFRTRDGIVTCERGTYTVTWRRDGDGVWRILADRSRPGEPEQAGPCGRK